MGVIWSGARGSGNNGFTRGGSFPLCPLEKGYKVANLVDSSVMEKKDRAPAVIASEHRIKPCKYLGVLMLAFPHLKTTATSWSEKVFEGRPSHTLNRPSPPGQGEGGV